MDETATHSVDFDTRVLTRFIYAFNISRQHTLSYPDDHPLVRKSALAMVDLLANLLEFRPRLTLGIARDSILVHGSVLDEKNPVFRKLASELFDLGIAAITFETGLTSDELLRFQRLAVSRPEELADRGGLAAACRDLDLRHIDISGIDYSAFSICEEAEIGAADAELEEERAGSLWDLFVGGLVEGTLDPQGEKTAARVVDPKLVAKYLNRRRDGGRAEETLASYEETITSFLRELDREGRCQSYRTESMEKLGNFVSSLSPDLRRQFLASTFNTLAAREDIAEDVIAHLSNDALFQALEDVNQQRLTIPPTIMNLLGKLSQHAEQPPPETGEQILSSAELGRHLRSLFREDDPDRYVPGTYQHLLHSIVSLEEIPPLETRESVEIREQLANEQVETKVCSILLDLLRQESEHEGRDRLLTELIELIYYFVELGQFDVLLDLHQRLTRATRDGLSEEVVRVLGERELLDHILEVLSVWDKERFAGIEELIRQIGPPFIEPMLDRLAVEKRRALRRFLIDRLLEMGDAIREPVLARLRDSRWFVVRNMLVILQRLADPVALYAIRALRRHPHPKVRLEVFKALRQFDDAEADLILADELAGDDPGRRRWAMEQVRRPLAEPLRDALIALMEKPDYSREMLELKHRAVTELAALGDPAALPVLEKVLNDKSLLHLQGLAKLKLAIVESLERYPFRKVQDLLELLAANGGRLGDAAQKILLARQDRQAEKMRRLRRRRP
ncbi:HEAT repeat protein [Geothermobacter ehrlichii]|uniref:HEAT repeat protein n=1 Tax=Geothermobacter ehrlichii TaxID=213224 RepID=A0A5D3WIV2_9BACT|nr:HEAT repeat domain-containing protein [Geothermobacter ehrlichii]TYO98095.1 HEAT repeat protein [Geothermobacter ehrlichii]